MGTMNKTKSAIKIQRFWQKKRGYTGLSGTNNYDYYLSLLSLSDSRDPYTKLAKMMYGRVVATPQAGFPFLKQQNPYIGLTQSYHRSDIHGSNLTSIILKQWAVEEHDGYLYIPVVNTELGTIDDAMRALDWTLNINYQLIEPPKELPNAHHLKFIKIRSNPHEDSQFTVNNRWGKLSSLGIIASPWVLSKSAIDGGFIPLSNPTSTPSLIKQSLERQPKTIDELKNSDLFKKLKQLKEKSTSESSLLAKGLYSIINDLPSNIKAPDIIARLSFFIETALLMHHDDHTRMANFVSAIIHEVSLLLLKHGESQKAPMINVEEYQTITATEMKQWIDISNPEYQFVALPAHSGSHANFIASKLAQDIGQRDGDRPRRIRREGGEYWEVMDHSRSYTLFGELVTQKNAEIVRLSAGPIGDYHAGTYPAIDINKLIRKEVQTNKKLQTLIIDTTSASYQHLKLAPDVLKLIAEKKVSLVFWESCQKFGLLHTDQAQYGRVFAYCHKNSISPSYIESLKEKAASDMHIPDVQIGAFINKNTHDIMPKIREKHFDNGLIFRQVLSGNHYEGINKNYAYELRVDNQKDPFFYLEGNFNHIEIKKIEHYFKNMNLERTSFGHRYTTQEGGRRISAGAENAVDANIFARSLKYYVTLSPKEIYQKIIENSKKLDIFNKEQLINYLSLIKAWQVCSEPSMPITWMVAYQLRSIISQSDALNKTILTGGQQFLTDIYIFIKTNSPFKAMMEEASDKNNLFAIKLFEALDNTFKKTGKMDINNAIKKVVRLMEKIPIEQKIDEKIILQHKQKLISGDYSQIAANFFISLSEELTDEQKFKHMLGMIEQKRQLFLTKHQHDAAEAALNLHQALERASKIYYSKDANSADYNQFKTSCIEAIDSARTILQHHRGWTDFLTKLVLTVVSFGIIPGALALRSKIDQGTWNFRLFETDSTKQLNAISEHIDKVRSLSF